MSKSSEEQIKLQKQAPKNIMFYHQMIGTMKLINATALLTDTEISWFGKVTEDEVNKKTLQCNALPLGYVILRFTIFQLVQEQINNSIPEVGFSYINKEEITHLSQLFLAFKDKEIVSFFEQSLDIYKSETLPAKIKVLSLRSLQDQVQYSGLQKTNSSRFISIINIKKTPNSYSFFGWHKRFNSLNP